MKTQHENEKERAKNSNMKQFWMCVERCEIDEDRCNSDICKRWIMNLKAIERKAEKTPENDIRSCMILQCFDYA